uniref:Small ribosomal subunit protein mS31 n=1 Tax=Ditylenchus dipsaci TaxID=166011 RepID=A0A915DUX9_9BILA
MLVSNCNDYEELLLERNLAKPHNLSFWKQWDDDAILLCKQQWGPKSAVEEQIEWTKQGKMWPYPINNEYMLGPEQKVSFAKHVFLEPEWEKHGVPRSKSVDHFMELVLVGLSKNPYMSAEKKQDHVKWFAKCFKEEMGGKYKEMF